jgi:cobalt/nickel transport system permease protein
VIDEGFLHGDSVIHRLDPRVKTLVAMVFSVVVATSDRILALVPAVLIALALIFLAGLPKKRVFTRLLLVNGLILLLWFFLPFTFEGRPLITIGPLVATREGITHAILITLKSNTIVLSLMALIATMSIFTLGRALRHLRVPAKIVHLFFFAYRYVHVVGVEYQRLTRTVKVRGFQPGTNMNTYRTYAYLVGMLLVKSHDRAERIRAAMLCRGFSGRFHGLRQFDFKSSDLVIMVLMLLAFAGVALLQWTRIIY